VSANSKVTGEGEGVLRIDLRVGVKGKEGFGTISMPKEDAFGKAARKMKYGWGGDIRRSWGGTDAQHLL